MLFGKLTRRGEQKQTGETAPAAMPIAPAMRSSSNSDSRGERPAEARAIHEAEELSMQQIEAAAGEPKNASVAAAAAQVAAKPQSMANETNAHERRAKRRALISAPVRERSVNTTRNAVDDVTTTLNASRMGILLTSSNPIYFRGMDVMVTFPYTRSAEGLQAEQPGRVVRISELPDGQRSIAIALSLTNKADEFILANGETVRTLSEGARVKVERDPNSSRPLVLAVDSEAALRESLKSYLKNEGYDVIAVSTAREAREVLAECTPALLIAEIEGEGMPGYDLCVYCKSTPRLQKVPVLLTTSSAYPSDYASAHSLGAMVCMAKPYRQDRLGNVVKLLAPPPKAKENCAPPRPADPTRRHLGGSKPIQPPVQSAVRRLLFLKK